MNERYSVPQVCRLIGTSRQVVYALRRAGVLPPGFKIGKRRYWTAEDLQAYLDRCNGGKAAVKLSELLPLDQDVESEGE